MADDLGYSDIGCYGGVASTPNIDALSESGIRFSNFYAAAPNCSPSRAALLTGRNPSRVGMYSYRPGWGEHPMHLRSEEITIAELLKGVGYKTAHFGKWHLGCLPQNGNLNQPQPEEQGFDYSLATENNAIPSHFNPVNFVRNGKKVGKIEGYSCQIVVGEAIKWLKNYSLKEEPFFMNVWFHEVHTKVASPPELVEKFGGYSRRDAEYFANIENMDSAVGKILDELKDRDLLDNTLLIFTSDNGPYRNGSQGEFRGLKGEVYEGGIHVPGIVYWPAKIKKGRKTDMIAGLIDIFPTICDICNIPLPEGRKFDGESIKKLINGEEMERSKPMLWYFYRSNPEIAMRMGDYILMAYSSDTVPRTHYLSDKDMDYIKATEFDKFEMYNFKDDVGQQYNISDEEPEILEDLKSKLNSAFENIISESPYWEGLPGYDLNKAKRKDKYRRK
jgi:arylsulfatase A